MEFGKRGEHGSMRQNVRGLWNALRGETCGAEIAETAAVLPLLFMVLLAIYWFGQAYRIYGTATHAARIGAEAAVAPLCTTCGTGTTPALAAQTAAQNALVAANLNKNQLVSNSTWTVPPPALCACGSGSASCGTPLACDASVTNMCVQVNAQLSYPSQGGMGTCGTSVSLRYQYPYHFQIPFTGLDLGNMQLPGQAEMRSETQ
jgi:Flp pilus assembly protein TadG